MTLRGWKEITEHTKLTPRVIKSLLSRNYNPFPLVYVARKPLTTKKLFAEWIESEVGNPNKGEKNG